MANMVCATFRLPEKLVAMHDYIETLDDTKFLSIVTTANDATGHSYGIVTTKT